MTCGDVSHIWLGPRPESTEELATRSQAVVDRIINAVRGETTMERVRAKFTVSNLLKDQYGTVVVKLYAVYKGDESSPENESFANSTPSGTVELCITNPAAGEFFEKLLGKYVYLDFTEA